MGTPRLELGLREPQSLVLKPLHYKPRIHILVVVYTNPYLSFCDCSRMGLLIHKYLIFRLTTMSHDTQLYHCNDTAVPIDVFDLQI